MNVGGYIALLIRFIANPVQTYREWREFLET